MTMRRLTPLVSKVVASTAILLMVAGSVLVYFIPRDAAIDKKYAKPEPTHATSYSVPAPDPVITHSLIPKAVVPSVTKSRKTTAKPKPLVSQKPVVAPPATVSTRPTRKPPSKPSAPVPSSSVSISPKPTPTPTPTPTPSVPVDTPTATPVSTVPTATTMSVSWTTSATATAAAERMATAGVVGDPVCSVSGTGSMTADIPSDVTAVGTGQSGNYWCLIFTR